MAIRQVQSQICHGFVWRFLRRLFRDTVKFCAVLPPCAYFLTFLALCLLWPSFTALLKAEPLSVPRLAAQGVQIADGTVPPWIAVGHVNIGGYRQRKSCTGTLIGPDIVLTAGHCVFDAKRGKPHRARNIHFVTGVARDNYTAHGKAACVHMPRYVEAHRSGKKGTALLAADIALIVLKRGLDVAPLEVLDRAPAALSLSHPSFPARRRYLMSVDPKCKIVQRSKKLWLTDCYTSQGSSGGPLLAQIDGRYRVAGVMVALRTDAYSIAVPVDAHQSLLARKACGK